MKRILLTITILALSIVLSGCNSGSQDTPVLESPYVGGTNGIVAEFEIMGSVILAWVAIPPPFSNPATQ